MKKIAAMLLVIVLAAGFCACARQTVTPVETEKPAETESPESTENNEATEEPEAAPTPTPANPHPVLVIDVAGTLFYATLEENGSADEFAERLSIAPVTVDMHDYGGFEKVGDLPWTIPRNDTTITTVPGDVILYQGDQITLYYGENTWEFTKLAHIENVTKEELLKALGDGNVTVRFYVEWRV